MCVYVCMCACLCVWVQPYRVAQEVLGVHLNLALQSHRGDLGFLSDLEDQVPLSKDTKRIGIL